MSKRDQERLPAHVAMHVEDGTTLPENLSRVVMLAGHLFRLAPSGMLTFTLAAADRALRGPRREETAAHIRDFLRDRGESPWPALYLPPGGAPLPASLEAAATPFRRLPSPDGPVLAWLLDYSARGEILEATARMAADARAPGRPRPSFELRLRTAGLPDPDLVILVGPAPLMPDFLLFQSAYAEFHIPAAGWADFAPRDLDRALADFSRRDRRFGRV